MIDLKTLIVRIKTLTIGELRSYGSQPRNENQTIKQ